MLAIATALEGMSRAAAARAAGMDRGRRCATRSCATTPKGSMGSTTVRRRDARRR
jgi:hypothetical protein